MNFINSEKGMRIVLRSILFLAFWMLLLSVSATVLGGAKVQLDSRHVVRKVASGRVSGELSRGAAISMLKACSSNN